MEKASVDNWIQRSAFLLSCAHFLFNTGLAKLRAQAILRGTFEDLYRAAPAVAGVPRRIDRTLTQLQRGELVVQTEPVFTSQSGNGETGIAIFAGSLIVASAVLTFHESTYEVPVLVLAIGFLLIYFLDR